mmetsp:Transcript_1257/g.3292  ORF Transcript_1257/g.3292 Transcript_1257/m.3292 type:complete len:87 (+) Transcript_1257:26-286(+)
MWVGGSVRVHLRGAMDATGSVAVAGFNPEPRHEAIIVGLMNMDKAPAWSWWPFGAYICVLAFRDAWTFENKCVLSLLISLWLCWGR